MRRRVAHDIRLNNWVLTSRFTLMSVVNGVGGTAPPSFVFKEKLLSYCQLIVDGQVAVESFA